MVQILSIYRDFNKASSFPAFSNLAFFSMDLLPEYLTFKESYAKFPVILPINELCTHNNE